VTAARAPSPTERRDAVAEGDGREDQAPQPAGSGDRALGRRGVLAVALTGLALAAGALAATGPAAGAAGLLVAVFATLLATRLGSERVDANPSELSRAWTAALALVPGAATVYLAFASGGFFPLTFAFAGLLAGALLLVHVTLAPEPFETLGAAAATAAGALALYAAWTLASGSWSGAPGRAFVEGARALLYLLVLLLFASSAGGTRRLRLMLRSLALGSVAVCAFALLSRLLPDLWPVAPGEVASRLSYPLTYSNALGLIAALGALLSVHLTSDHGERGPTRVLAASALPGLAVALLLTLSRGAIGAGLAGLVVYVALARPRALPGAVLAATAPIAFAVVFAYRSEVLFTDDRASLLARSEGRAVVLVLVLCTLGAATLRTLLLPLDANLTRLRLSRRTRFVGVAVAVAAALAAAIPLAAALEAPARAAAKYERFFEAGALPATYDQRARLSEAGSNFRLAYWRVAVEAFREQPARGSGAGTYALLWARDRPVAGHKVENAHSLYLETAAELGAVGLVLLGTALMAMLAAALACVRGAHRAAYACVASVLVTWLVHAGVDWDWEMPALTVAVFAVGGHVLGREGRVERPRARAPRPRRSLPTPRLAAALACSVVIAVPALLLGFEARLDAAADAARAGDCKTAATRAASARALLDARPEPYRILGLCRARAGSMPGAVRAYAAAARRDPGNWRDQYALALARSAAGLDARPEARRARRLNPRHPWSAYAVRLLAADDPEVRRAQALFAPGAPELLGAAPVRRRAPAG
jgi:hypothetical protein